jgi:hypothetical protein
MNISTNISAGKKLSTLSDSQLISRLQLLCKQERRTTLNIILHLAEIDERRAYLQRGYWSLFDYCTRRGAGSGQPGAFVTSPRSTCFS